MNNLTKKEIAEGSKLIAKFMNIYVPEGISENEACKSFGGLFLYSQEDPHRESIESILPVINRCYGIDTLRLKQFISYKDLATGDVISCFKGVVQFIEWYNEREVELNH